MAISSLRQRTISGMLWSSLMRFGTLGISFITDLVLARMLVPEDYGIVGMLMIFISLANLLVEGGFGSALIQDKEDSQASYSTVFYWNILFSVILYSVIYALSPSISKFYNMPILSKILRIEGIIIIINSLYLIQRTILTKQLKFKQISIISIFSSMVSAFVAIVLAIKGYGVWALVTKAIIEGGVLGVLFWFIGKWSPSLVFDLKSFKRLFKYGGFLLASNLINTLCNELIGLIIGRKFNAVILGYYSKARSLENVPTQSVSTIISQVSFPVFSEMQDDINRMSYALQRIMKNVALVVFPLMIALIVVAYPLIIFLYTDKWADCVPYFQLLCVGGIFITFQGPTYYAVAALGKSKALFNWTIIKRILGLVSIIVGMYFNMQGLLIGSILSTFFIYIINAYLVHKYIGYKFHKQMLDIMPYFSVAIITGVFCWVIGQFLEIHLYLKAILQLFVYVITYLTLLCTIKAINIRDILSCIKIYVNKIINLK